MVPILFGLAAAAFVVSQVYSMVQRYHERVAFEHMLSDMTSCIHDLAGSVDSMYHLFYCDSDGYQLPPESDEKFYDDID